MVPGLEPCKRRRPCPCWCFTIRSGCCLGICSGPPFLYMTLVATQPRGAGIEERLHGFGGRNACFVVTNHGLHRSLSVSKSRLFDDGRPLFQPQYHFSCFPIFVIASTKQNLPSQHNQAHSFSSPLATPVPMADQIEKDTPNVAIGQVQVEPQQKTAHSNDHIEPVSG